MTQRRSWSIGPHEVVLEMAAPGCFVVVDTRNLNAYPALAKRGAWEPNVDAIITNSLRPGDVYVGGGSCFGYCTVFAAKCVGPRGRVIAFEANPWLADMTRRSCRWSECAGWVDLYSSVIGPPSEDEYATMCFDVEQVSGGSVDYGEKHQDLARDLQDAVEADTIHAVERFMLDSKGSYRPVPRSIYVTRPRTTIDALVPDEPANMIHVDVEDWSHPALLGAIKLIERSPDLSIIAEFAESQLGTEVGARAVESWRMLREMGFTARHIGRMRDGADFPELIPIETEDSFLHPAHDFANILWTRTPIV